MAFDFGRSIIADEQYVLPNFAAHIALAILGGSLPVEKGIAYLKELVRSYDATITADKKANPEKFIQYFVAELLHRGLAIRWIDKRLLAKTPLVAVQLAVNHLANKLLIQNAENSIISIDNVIELIGAYRRAIENGAFTDEIEKALSQI